MSSNQEELAQASLQEDDVNQDVVFVTLNVLGMSDNMTYADNCKTSDQGSS